MKLEPVLWKCVLYTLLVCFCVMSRSNQHLFSLRYVFGVDYRDTKLGIGIKVMLYKYKDIYVQTGTCHFCCYTVCAACYVQTHCVM